MFILVKTNEGTMAAVNVDRITHLSVAAFSGQGCKVYFSAKEGMSVRDSMESILAQIEGKAPSPYLETAD